MAPASGKSSTAGRQEPSHVQKRLASWSIDWLDRSTKGLIEVWDQPKTKAEQLAAARLDVYLSHHAPYSYKV